MSSSDSSFSARRRHQHTSHKPILLHSKDCRFLPKLPRLIQLTLLLLLLSRRIASGITTSGRSGTTSSCWGGTTTGADVQEELLDVLALEGFGEEGGPDWLDVGDFCGGDEGLEFVGLDGGQWEGREGGEVGGKGKAGVRWEGNELVKGGRDMNIQ